MNIINLEGELKTPVKWEDARLITAKNIHLESLFKKNGLKTFKLTELLKKLLPILEYKGIKGLKYIHQQEEFLIGYNGMYLFNIRQPKNSPNSQSIYLARVKSRDKSLQYLLPNAQTSRHRQENDNEYFVDLEGNGFVEINNKEFEIYNKSVLVKSNQMHQLKTKKITH